MLRDVDTLVGQVGCRSPQLFRVTADEYAPEHAVTVALRNCPVPQDSHAHAIKVCSPFDQLLWVHADEHVVMQTVAAAFEELCRSQDLGDTCWICK